jgi:aerobic-type carbon monoxide dehydrogenase small subunit (CoxS/CutS family)
MTVKFSVNGVPVAFDGPEDVPLLWVVREHLEAPVRTCVMPVVAVEGSRVTTIDALAAVSANRLASAIGKAHRCAFSLRIGKRGNACQGPLS